MTPPTHQPAGFTLLARRIAPVRAASVISGLPPLPARWLPIGKQDDGGRGDQRRAQRTGWRAMIGPAHRPAGFTPVARRVATVRAAWVISGLPALPARWLPIGKRGSGRRRHVQDSGWRTRTGPAHQPTGGTPMERRVAPVPAVRMIARVISGLSVPAARWLLIGEQGDGGEIGGQRQTHHAEWRAMIGPPHQPAGPTPVKMRVALVRAAGPVSELFTLTAGRLPNWKPRDGGGSGGRRHARRTGWRSMISRSLRPASFAAVERRLATVRAARAESGHSLLAAQGLPNWKQGDGGDIDGCRHAAAMGGAR